MQLGFEHLAEWNEGGRGHCQPAKVAVSVVGFDDSEGHRHLTFDGLEFDHGP